MYHSPPLLQWTMLITITRLIAIKGAGTAARQINQLGYCVDNVANFRLVQSLQPHAQRKVAESKRQSITLKDKLANVKGIETGKGNSG